MTMSKQDFEVIAERIYSYGETLDDDHATEDVDRVRLALANHFAASLAATNGMFKRDRFIAACTTGAHIRRSILPRP